MWSNQDFRPKIWPKTRGFGVHGQLEKKVFFHILANFEVRPMDVGSDWFGAIKQPLEGSSDHSP